MFLKVFILLKTVGTYGNVFSINKVSGDKDLLDTTEYYGRGSTDELGRELL